MLSECSNGKIEAFSLNEIEQRRLIAQILESRFKILNSKEELKISILHGGFSGASVFRVDRCKAILSLLDKKESVLSSLVIKINSKSGFDREAKNYSKISEEIKNILCPIDITKIENITGVELYYLINKDLFEYNTLLESILINRKNDKKIRKVISAVFEALLPFYSKSKRTNEFGLSSILYFSDMQEICRNIADKNIIERKVLTDIGTRLKQLQKNIRFEPTFTTAYHGDLHARNIMIREGDLDIKLIDYAHLDCCGDYIFDLGELIAYLSEILPIDQTFEVELPEINPEKTALSNLLRTTLEEESSKIVKAISGDQYWRERLLLSQARFLLKVASFPNGKKHVNLYAEKAKNKLEEASLLQN